MINSNVFHSTAGLEHQRNINMYMTLIVFEIDELTDDKGPIKLNLKFKIIENALFLLLMVFVNTTKQK